MIKIHPLFVISALCLLTSCSVPFLDNQKVDTPIPLENIPNPWMVNTPPIIGPELPPPVYTSPSAVENAIPNNQTPQSVELPLASSLWKEKLCVSTLCINPDKPYFEFWDSYVQFYINSKFINDQPVTLEPKDYVYAKKAQVTTYSNGEKNVSSSDPDVMDNIMIQIKKDGTSADYSEMWMGGEFKTIKKMSNGILMIQKGTWSCGWANIEQYFINEKNIQIPLKNAVGEFPKKFSVAGIPFDSYVPEGNVLYQGVANLPDAPERIHDIWSINDNIGEKIMDYILTKKRFNKSYAIEFREYPGTVFFYKSWVENSIAVIRLQTNGEKIDKNGVVQDKALTREIFDYYKPYDENNFYIPQSIQKKWAQDYKVFTADDIDSIMPVFRVRLFVDDYYLLYTTPEYISAPLAEMCKPVIYVYDDPSKAKSVTVKMPLGGTFTKIIPDFNTNHDTWIFSANKTGQIVSPGNTETFAYLYYSADIPGYEFNTRGWQVWWRDVENFFEEKLTKVGLNKKEKEDFIEYWKNEFEDNTLYFISFKFNKEIEKYIQLSFSENPKTLLRVIMEAYPLDQQLRKANYAWPEVGSRFDRDLLTSFERTGEFDVVEWWWTIYKSTGDVTIY